MGENEWIFFARKMDVNLVQFPVDKNSKIVIYCLSGRMSIKAVETLSLCRVFSAVAQIGRIFLNLQPGDLICKHTNSYWIMHYCKKAINNDSTL